MLARLMSTQTEARAFLRGAAGFVAIGLLLYVALYAAAEWLVYQRADRNRFFMVRTAPSVEYDDVILGASHAAVFDFDQMNRRLEELTGARILNLAVVGAGVRVNRVLLDYFLQLRGRRHGRPGDYTFDVFQRIAGIEGTRCCSSMA